MSSTYTQIYIHAVFAVRYRERIIDKIWKDELYKYITGILQNNGHKMLAIKGVADHIHIFFGMKPLQSLSDLMQSIKANSSKWINTKGFVRGHFSWQEGYGAFSYSHSQLSDVIRYVNNQEEHHKIRTFKEEYLLLLKRFDIEYQDTYLFDFFDNEM